MGCRSAALPPPSPPDDAGAGAPADASSAGDALPPVRDLDLLFMIDNSASMQEEQQNLIRNFPVLMDELKKIKGGLPNLHVAVVTSDLGAGSQPLSNGGCPRPGGDRGIFQTKPACGLFSNANFIVSADNGTSNNFQGDIADVFRCAASVGTVGCGYEHQLQATRVALYESITPENRTFLRRDAFLAIVLITDEDDCSADPSSDLFEDDASFPGTTGSFRCAQVGHLCSGLAPPVAEFQVPLASCTDNPAGRLIKVKDVVDSIRALKADPDRQIFAAGIFGWPVDDINPQYRYVRAPAGPNGQIDYAAICQSANGSATAGLRLKRFVDSFGANSSFASICQNDFRPALQLIGQRLGAMVR